jgi:hypothetical protein
MKHYPRPRPEPTSEEFLALLILLAPLVYVVRWTLRAVRSRALRPETHRPSPWCQATCVFRGQPAFLNKLRDTAVDLF